MKSKNINNPLNMIIVINPLKQTNIISIVSLLISLTTLYLVQKKNICFFYIYFKHTTINLSMIGCFKNYIVY